MKKRLKNYGWEILSTWAMGDTLEALSRAGEAAVNLVVSSVGIPAANVLKEKFGTPFLVGTPVEGYEGQISDALERIADRSCGEWVNKKDDSAEESGGQILGKQEELWKVTPEQVIYFQGRNSLSAVSDPSGESREMPDKDEIFFSVPDITIIGEPVTMGSLAAVIEQKYGKKVQLLCPLEDYDKVALYSPNNVLVYYNRAGVYAQLGEIERAVEDYTSAIKLYPDFANAYIYRGRLRELLRDPQGAKEDRSIAQRKIAEYRSRLNDSTYSIYADTTQRFDRLLSFDSKFAGGSFDRITGHNGGHEEMRLLPLFKFTLMRPDSVPAAKPYHLQRVDDFKKRIGNEYLTLSCRESNIAPDTLVMLDKQYVQELNASNPAWTVLFERAVTQSLIKQYTNSVSTYSSAIELNPSNPFLYLNRSTTRAEMIDFISSIDNSYQRITIDSDPANRLNNNSKRTYSYDEAVADLNKAVKLFPDFAYAYYNRANLLALSGSLPEAFEDYTKAISLNPAFAEAYYNRGIIQLFMKDTRKGCLDLSKAGELGITEAYEVLKRYASLDN